MRNAGATVWWIDRSCSVQSAFIRLSDLKGGATYQSEAHWVTDDAEHFEVIMNDRVEDPFEKERLEKLKLKAGELRNDSITAIRVA